MSTIEKQWLQIFERQRWVINQAKQQAFLFDQDLASKLIIAGITPPPSLFSHVLNHQELISEIPVPCTRREIPFTGSHCCVFEKPVATAHCRQLTNGLCAEHLGVKECFDVGGNVLDLPQCPISNGGRASNGVPQDHQEEDPSVTSPEVEGDARVSDVHHDSALQLARGAGKEGPALPPQCHISNAGCACIAVLQDQKEENTGSTSPEDQKHAEIVCLLKISNVVTQDHREEDASDTSPANERDARVSDVYHGLSLTPARGTEEEVSTLPQSQDQKEETRGGMSQNQGDARMLDIDLDPALSLARVQRSKPRQRAMAIRNSVQKSRSKDKDNIDGYAGETIKCLISTPQSEKVDELKEVHSEVGKSKIGEFQSKEKGSEIYSGRITRSRSSVHQDNSLNLSCSPCIHKTSDGIAVDSIGKLKQLSNHVIHLLELVSYSHVTNESCREGELKSGDHLSEEKQTVEENSMCANLEREVHTPEGLQEFEGPSVSKDNTRSSVACMSPDKETHLNEEHHMVQRNEDGMGLEGVDSSPNAPFTFLHEEKGASVSFLIKQAAGHPQDSLLEETGVTHPTSSNIDGRSHCLKENPVAVLHDNLGMENTEDFSCAGNTMQAERHSAGPRKFSELTCGAPHVKSSQSENVGELNDNHSEVVKQGEFLIKGDGTDIYSGRMTRSRSSGHQENSLNASGYHCMGRTNSGIALDIDTVGQMCSKGLSIPASKEEIHGSSSLKMHAEKKLEEVMTITTQGNCKSSLEMNFMGNHIISAKEMEVQGILGKALEVEFSKSRRSSNSNMISSVKEPLDAYMDAVPNLLLESRKTPKQKFSGIDDQTTLCVDLVGLVHSPVKEVNGCNLSTANAAKPTELVSEECAVGSNALCNPHISTDVDYGMVSGPGSYRILDAENLEVENTYAASMDELRSNLAQSTGNVHISPEYVQSSAVDDREVGCSEPTECQTAENSKRSSFCCSMEGTSPKHKRRKIEERVHDLSASVALVEEVHAVKKDSMCANMEREEHSAIALTHFQGHSVSQEDAGKLIISCSPVEEAHLYEDHMVESSESLPHAQKKQRGIGLEEVDNSLVAPFTFFHEEKEASVFSRLIMQSAGHPQDSLLEETGVALLQDDLKLENTEDLSCAGRTRLAKRFDFGGTSNFTELSGGAPHVKSLDLTSADDAVFERFVVRTDDEPCSFAEEGISFDEWNLSNPAVERASILEQLCRSACMQTPVAYSSASYKLDKVQNLQRSVPTGVLEHVDVMTTLPINDNIKQLKDGNSCWSEEVGSAFYERSYSDYLPNFSGHSGWDTKKTYFSPIGKLWDRISSSSSSSGKRVSSVPELACIREENENADEVADTFQDGIVSEVLDCSPKRLPLADITEVPNLPASVSKAAPCTDRFSLDSVTTEVSLTGTHKCVKKKPGVQNSTKRRYNNKENNSVSRGRKDIKRATGSLQGRYSKPKFSGTTSLRKGGPSLSELEPKRNNIVSNITSFIPLVQQKQAAAAVPGKRDIKVKALEAAEAAKRLAERKDNERKMKKEAMKVERARVEQENVRKLELQRKRKEEERKKNEADMAAKKRQREDEDKKEKQRKRIRLEEGRREQREHEEQKRAEKVKKEVKCQDGRECENKQSKCNTVQKKKENLRSISETDPRSSCVSANNARRGTAVHEEYYKGFTNFEHKEETNLDEATENEKLVPKTSQEQSYDISPYKESDDEDEEEDDDSVPNNKFIPSWASKNFLALVASRQSRTDPELLFPPKSFCCISEVLLPQKF